METRCRIPGCARAVLSLELADVAFAVFLQAGQRAALQRAAQQPLIFVAFPRTSIFIQRVGT